MIRKSTKEFKPKKLSQSAPIEEEEEEEKVSQSASIEEEEEEKE